MSKAIDHDKPLSAKDIRWLHSVSQDYLIEANLRRFAQADVHAAGDPVDVKKALAEAGVKVPGYPEGPTFVDGAPLTPTEQVPVDEAQAEEIRKQAEAEAKLAEAQQESEDAPAAEELDEEALRIEIEKLDVEELKEALKARDKAVSGNKSELRDRLFEAVKAEYDDDDDSDDEGDGQE